MFPATRCLAMIDAAAENLHRDPEEVASIEILPEPTPEVVNGVTILRTVGGATPISVRVTLKDGATRETWMCGGVASGPACTDHPYIPTGGKGPGAGFRDVPCLTDSPDRLPDTVPVPGAEGRGDGQTHLRRSHGRADRPHRRL